MSELIDAVEHLDWEAFQEPEDGRLYVHFNGELIRLSYRIGLHMRKPMEVVMGRGDYLKLRAAPQFEQYELGKLDPENVDRCVYHQIPNSFQSTNSLLGKHDYHKLWHPKLLKNAGLTTQNLIAQAQQLAQMQQYQSLLGGNSAAGLGGYNPKGSLLGPLSGAFLTLT